MFWSSGKSFKPSGDYWGVKMLNVGPVYWITSPGEIYYNLSFNGGKYHYSLRAGQHQASIEGDFSVKNDVLTLRPSRGNQWNAQFDSLARDLGLPHSQDAQYKAYLRDGVWIAEDTSKGGGGFYEFALYSKNQGPRMTA